MSLAPRVIFTDDGPFYRAVRGHFAYEWHGGNRVYVLKPRCAEAGGGFERLVDDFLVADHVRGLSSGGVPTLTQVNEAVESYEP